MVSSISVSPNLGSSIFENPSSISLQQLAEKVGLADATQISELSKDISSILINSIGPHGQGFALITAWDLKGSNPDLFSKDPEGLTRFKRYNASDLTPVDQDKKQRLQDQITEFFEQKLTSSFSLGDKFVVDGIFISNATEVLINLAKLIEINLDQIDVPRDFQIKIQVNPNVTNGGNLIFNLNQISEQIQFKTDKIALKD